jgi:hypothetical protein
LGIIFLFFLGIDMSTYLSFLDNVSIIYLEEKSTTFSWSFPFCIFCKEGVPNSRSTKSPPRMTKSFWEEAYTSTTANFLYFIFFNLRMSLIFITSSTMLYLGSWVNLLLVMVYIFSLNHESVFVLHSSICNKWLLL